jgi:hypothetical protein
MFFAAKYKDEGIIEKLHDKESYLICSLIYQLKYSQAETTPQDLIGSDSGNYFQNI